MNSDTASTYNHMKLALDSATREAREGEADSAKEHLEIATALAARMMKEVGR